MQIVILLLVFATASALKLNTLERKKRDDGTDNTSLDDLTSGSHKSQADLHEIYDRIYADMFKIGGDGATQPTKTPTATHLTPNNNSGEGFHINAVMLNGSPMNVVSGRMDGSQINKGAASGDEYYLVQNGTYIEATSSGDASNNAALTSNFLLTDNAAVDKNILMQGNVAATGNSTFVRLTAGGGEESRSNGVVGSQQASASGSDESNASVSLTMKAN
uniref:Uncharacterized protein n=1 Tax=Plectus sambesii TaxID=2011161 RepID=A0A914VSV8_9BILA